MKREFITFIVAACVFGVTFLLNYKSIISNSPAPSAELGFVLVLVLAVAIASLLRLRERTAWVSATGPKRNILLGAACALVVGISFPLADRLAPDEPSVLAGTAPNGDRITSLALTESESRYFKAINHLPRIEIGASEHRELSLRLQRPFLHAAVQFSAIALGLAAAALLQAILGRRRDET